MAPETITEAAATAANHQDAPIVTTTYPRETTLDILRRLIAFPTVSRDSNLQLIEWVQGYLETLGFAVRLSYDATRGKANLFASTGTGTGGGILLSGHTDVVPVDGQDWHTDPFNAEIINGRVHGRGACDMKGYLAVVLSSVALLDRSTLEHPIHLAFTYDEEVGCKGVRTLLADLRSAGIQPSACIVGEPTGMQIVRAHKGSRNYRCSVHGKEAHASRTQDGVNAIQHAARVISYIDDLAEEFAQNPQADSSFETPFDTIQASLVQGGMARNIVPRNCEFTFGYRYLPQSDPDRIFERVRDYGLGQVLPRMQARHEGARMQFENLSDNPALSPGQNAAIAQFAMGLDGALGAGPGAGYMTEGGLYQRSGIPTVICGPGSIVQAHRPDEFVELAQLAACERFMSSLWMKHEQFSKSPKEIV